MKNREIERAQERINELTMNRIQSRETNPLFKKDISGGDDDLFAALQN